MSGIIPEDGSDYLKRYHQRFNELFKKDLNKNSVASSFFGTLGESLVDGQCSNNRGQGANGTLTAQQFYKQFSSDDPRQYQAGHFSSKASSSCTFTGASDASIFKKPLPVRKKSCRPLVREELQLYIDFLCSLDDKQTIKFALRTIGVLVCSIKKHITPPAQPVNPVYLMEYISNTIKDEYFSKQIPKSICGSSIISDQASNYDQCASSSERSIRLDRPFVSSAISGAGNSERSIQLDRTSGPSATSDPRIVLQDITQASLYRGELNKPSQVLPNREHSSISGVTGYLSNHQQETSTVSEAAKKKGRPKAHPQLSETLSKTENIFDILNDSELARMRDEAVARQESMSSGKFLPKKSSKTLPKPTPSSRKITKNTKASTTANKKSMESVPVSEKSSFDQTNKNMSLLNGTATGVSRCGRIRKPPVKYWNSKGLELSYTEPDESVFNESMTLRNGKKKTPTLNSKSNSALTSISENKIDKPPMKKPRGTASRNSLLAEKENTVSEKKKPLKKQTDTAVKKNTLSKGKTNKKKELINQNTEKTEKKAAPKRKAKEQDASLGYKKKKIEDTINHGPSDDSEDDLFGGVSYKKPAHQTLKVALSPSSGLLSAKKAAGEAQGKATPPCKAIGDMMMNESIRSTMSSAKEAPKQNEAVVKRIVKKLEKKKVEPAKSRVKKTRKENYNLIDNERSAFYINDPMCSATLTVFNGAEQNSDLSDMEQDEDDDLM